METFNDKLTRKGSKHAQPELRAQQIIDAAIICFGENGFANTTIDSIGKFSGLSKGTVYRFFASKDELLLSVIDFIQSEFESRFERMSIGKSCLEQLDIFCKINIEDIIGEKELMSMWIQILNLSFTHEKLKTMFQDDFATVSRIIEEGIVRGEFAESALQSVPHALLALLHGHLLLAYMSEEEPKVWVDKFNHSWALLKKELVQSPSV